MAASSAGPLARRRVLGPLWRLVDEVGYRFLTSLSTVLAALPSRWILPLGDHLGAALYVVDSRGRRAGRDNLRAVFGEALTTREKREILLASYRNSLRSIALLLHASPMTSERLCRWVDVSPEMAARVREAAAAKGCVTVSGHVGNWELLLGLGTVIDDLPEMVFLAEAFTWKPLDRWLAYLRGSGGGVSATRRGGARSLNSHLRRRGIAALLADRNLRRAEGGIWAPFLGLQARSTPLPGWLAVRNGVPVLPVFCLPQADGRYRFWAGPDLMEGVDTSDQDAAILEITTRINRVLESTIRAHPGIWNWTLKRFKSRPDRDLGPYPPYSLWDA